MEKNYKIHLTNDLIWSNFGHYEFKTPKNKRGFYLSDVLSWLSNVGGDPFRELKNRIINELDIINPHLVETSTGTRLWKEVERDVKDKIIDAETIYFTMKYERRGDIFFRRDQLDLDKDTIKVEVNFTIDDNNYYNGFVLSVYIPTPQDTPELSARIRDKVSEIISDLIKSGKINDNNVYVRAVSSLVTDEDIHYLCRYKAIIDKEYVSEAVKMMLGILDGTKEILEELKKHYSR